MKIIKLLFNWTSLFIMLLLIPLIVAVLLIAIVLDEIMFFLKHNKKYLVDGTNWITEVFK